MTDREMEALVLKECKDIVYIADPLTYELFYLNDTALELIGSPAECEWKKNPCYQVMQNLDAPCPFCTNELLDHEQFYVWEHYNEARKRQFTIREKLIQLNGRQLRLKIAVDTTKVRKMTEHLSDRLKEEEMLIASIQTLNEREDYHGAIHQLLENMGRFYGGDRAYIFEVFMEQGKFKNTYEWCDKKIEPQLENLKNIPLSALDSWRHQFETKGAFYISALETETDKESMEYQILNDRQISGLMAAPLMQQGEIVGFLGVDNPRYFTDRMALLRSIASFVINDMQKQRMTNQLKQLIYNDVLTGLGNRNHYMQVLEEMEQNLPETIGILFLDINGLKIANDTYGHQYGDHLIQYAAEVLKKKFAENVFRIGGDEFVVLCPNIKKNEFNDKVLQLRRQVQKDEELKVSIGASWHTGCKDIAQQITHVDDLMYIDKQKYYGMRLGSMGNYHAGLSKQLIHEIAEGRFRVYLQPKIDLKSEQIAGAEALVRKWDEKGRQEEPGKFIAMYETEGIIRHIDFFVLSQVCRTLKEWRENRKQLIKIAVNISRVTLLEHDITEKLLEVCNSYGIEPEWINIEVTESIGTMEEQELRELMDKVKNAGFTISLDDFGSQYSNLAILTSMDFNEIKLDKSLINNLESNHKSRVITEHTIKMCHDLELMLSVAEGIENCEQKNLLQKYDCAVGQGFYFDRPMPIEDFVEKYIVTNS